MKPITSFSNDYSNWRFKATNSWFPIFTYVTVHTYKQIARRFMILLTLFCLACNKPHDITFINSKPEDLFRLAQKTNKKVFILISDSTCGSCNNFVNFLNTQSVTKTILAEDYICYKADIRDSIGREIARIVKCPSYPFPYFFDNRGNLLAFGFPQSKSYDISNLNNITVEKSRFMELFKLPISVSAYKNLVTLNMQATLLLLNKDSLSAYNKFKKSLGISVYPYNFRHVQLLSKDLKLPTYTYLNTGLVSNASDDLLYGNLQDYMLLNNGSVRSKNKINTDYQILDSSKELGEIKKGRHVQFSFKVQNLSDKPLIIFKVSYPCECIKMKWPAKPIIKNAFATIHGDFEPYGNGDFDKEIFIHTNSAKVPMGIFTLIGTIK
jgi:hypothetical protein